MPLFITYASYSDSGAKGMIDNSQLLKTLFASGFSEKLEGLLASEKYCIADAY